jgi:hypothetical protein
MTGFLRESPSLRPSVAGLASATSRFAGALVCFFFTGGPENQSVSFLGVVPTSGAGKKAHMKDVEHI